MQLKFFLVGFPAVFIMLSLTETIALKIRTTEGQHHRTERVQPQWFRCGLRSCLLELSTLSTKLLVYKLYPHPSCSEGRSINYGHTPPSWQRHPSALRKSLEHKTSRQAKFAPFKLSDCFSVPTRDQIDNLVCLSNTFHLLCQSFRFFFFWDGNENIHRNFVWNEPSIGYLLQDENDD